MSILGIFVGKDITQYSVGYFITQVVKSLLQKGKMWHFWYLGTLILLYLLLLLRDSLYSKSMIFKRIRNHFGRMLWGLMVLISIVLQVCSLLHKEALQQHVMQTFRLWSWMQYFILGGLIPHIQSKIIKKISLRIHLLLLCISTIFIIGYQYIIGKYILNTMYAEYFYDSIFAIVWVFILYTYVLRLQILEVCGKRITFVCSLTLGVYIIHPIVNSIVKKLILVNSRSIALCSFIIVLFTSFTVVWLLSKIKFIQKWFLTL